MSIPQTTVYRARSQPDGLPVCRENLNALALPSLVFFCCSAAAFLGTLWPGSDSLNKLYRTSGDLDLSSTDAGLNNYSFSLAGEAGLSGGGEYGSKDDNSPEMMEMTRTSTVKFQDGSDDDSITGTESEVS
jgi:hypothetical protein